MGPYMLVCLVITIIALTNYVFVVPRVCLSPSGIRWMSMLLPVLVAAAKSKGAIRVGSEAFSSIDPAVQPVSLLELNELDVEYVFCCLQDQGSDIGFQSREGVEGYPWGNSYPE
jgi:predicted neutral ceramidase superfamily lipid hydrolase